MRLIRIRIKPTKNISTSHKHYLPYLSYIQNWPAEWESKLWGQNECNTNKLKYVHRYHNTYCTHKKKYLKFCAEFLAEAAYISIDPYQRMKLGDNYPCDMIGGQIAK